MRLVRLLALFLAVAVAWPLLADDPPAVAKPDPKAASTSKDKAGDKTDAKDKPDGKDKTDGKDKPKDKADAKDKPKDKTEGKPKDGPRYVVQGSLQGKLEAVPASGKVSLSVLVLGKDWQKVELPHADEIKIRTLNPPPAFDEKGRLKRYTPKELQELKGPDRRLPGYTAEAADLRPGQVVEVQLVRKVGRPKNPKDKAEVAEYDPKVNLIVILSEPNP